MKKKAARSTGKGPQEQRLCLSQGEYVSVPPLRDIQSRGS